MRRLQALQATASTFRIVAGRWLLLVLLAMLLVVAYLNIPARLAVFALQWRLGSLELDDVDGDAWNGESQRTFWGEHALGHLRWSADPLAALGGTIRTDVYFDMPKNQRMNARVERRLRTMEVTSLHADLVGGALRKFFTRARLLPIGTLSVEVDRARFEDGVPVAVQGRASWKQATLVGPRTRLPYYLGDLLVDFRVDEPGIVLGSIRDSGGPMQVSGSVRADVIGYRIELHLAPRDPQLLHGLTRLGQAQLDGSRLLVLQDAWWWKRRHG